MQATQDFNTWITGIHNRHNPKPLIVDDYEVLPRVMCGIIVILAYRDGDEQSHLECIDLDEFMEWVEKSTILDEHREHWVHTNKYLHGTDKFDVELRVVDDFFEHDCNHELLAEFLNKKNGIHK